MVERLFRARHGEQAQACRVQHHERRAWHVLYQLMQDEGEGGRHERHHRVVPVANGHGRDGADEQIANDSAGQRGGERQHHHAEEIEPGRHGGERAFEGEDEDAGQIEDDE